MCEERGRSAESETPSFPNEDVGGVLPEPEGSSISRGHRVCREILCVCGQIRLHIYVYVILGEWFV